ncbi:MAG: hypothetical protein Ct9H300mP23_03460 [Nitrospinota bacterium]|nr:MAG: hypothetical protein Ct9H300mP23_03460 [Nitrospinota bacterium]
MGSLGLDNGGWIAGGAGMFIALDEEINSLLKTIEVFIQRN